MPEKPTNSGKRIALAEWLETNRHEIVTDWTNAVRDDPQIPDADRLTLAALQDHLPEMLADLIGTLRDPETVNGSETKETGQDHGKARWRNRYRLDEVLRELARVREILLVWVRKFCDERNDSKLRDDSDERVRRFFDIVIVESARQFMREQEAELLLRSQQLQHAYEQVQAATEQLRAVAQSRLQLLRGVSHELRNALQAVTWGTNALQQDANRENRNSILSKLSGNVGQLQRILDRLQGFSNILAGEVKLQLGKLDVPDFLAKLEKPHRAAAEEKGLGWRCTAAADLPTITTDCDKLRHIADVLLTNAVDYSDHGSIDVKISADVPGRWIFSVTDTGIGIGEADAKQVFHEFHRTAETSHQGLGLGLVIARHLARLMDGEITFRSKPEEGSCFELNLPADLASAPPSYTTTHGV